MLTPMMIASVKPSRISLIVTQAFSISISRFSQRAWATWVGFGSEDSLMSPNTA